MATYSQVKHLAVSIEKNLPNSKILSVLMSSIIDYKYYKYNIYI